MTNLIKNNPEFDKYSKNIDEMRSLALQASNQSEIDKVIAMLIAKNGLKVKAEKCVLLLNDDKTMYFVLPQLTKEGELDEEAIIELSAAKGRPAGCAGTAGTASTASCFPSCASSVASGGTASTAS